ncbi:uncharacterized protein ABDE67_018284 [Symphorus nematophorus]
MGTVKLGAAMDVMDGASPVTLNKKTVDIEKLRRNCTGKKIKKKVVDMLKLKETEKLTFVYQTVYNTAPVTFFDKVKKDSSAAFKIFTALSVSGKKNEETTFTVPKDSTFAYGLMEIQTEDGTLELKMKEGLLQPLAGLPESTRQDLLKTLGQLLEDRNALAQLLDQLSTKVSDCPQSQAVSSFMELLKASNTSQKDAVEMLVNAMDTLPDGVPALLTTCSPDTLRVLKQLVSSLKEDGQAKLPESLPPPLQEGGELRWAAELLCSTNETLRELSEQWDRPEFPAVLLEVLCLVVSGLSLMSS